VLRDRRAVQAARTAAIGDVTTLMERHWLAVKRREKAFAEQRRAP
jgi:hypothetical protein